MNKNNYIKYVLEALDKVGGVRAGYKSLALQLETKTLLVECRNGKNDLRVYKLWEWGWEGGYQRYWPSVPSEDKRKIGEECRKILEWDSKYREEEM